MTERLPSEREALKILRDVGCSEKVIDHCRAVADLAVEIAKRCVKNGLKVNMDLVKIGGLLHDIGRSRTHTVNHAIEGSKIAKKLNLPSVIVKVIERHVGGGIPIEEAKSLGWPPKDYTPQSIEEKIITYADKLIEGSRRIKIERTIKAFEEKLGKNHPAIQRLKDLHKEMESYISGL